MQSPECAVAGFWRMWRTLSLIFAAASPNAADLTKKSSTLAFTHGPQRAGLLPYSCTGLGRCTPRRFWAWTLDLETGTDGQPLIQTGT